MTIQELYKKYKQFDDTLSDPIWLTGEDCPHKRTCEFDINCDDCQSDNNFRNHLLLDIWKIIKKSV